MSVLINGYVCEVNRAGVIQLDPEFELDEHKHCLTDEIQLDCTCETFEPYTVKIHQYEIYECGYTHDIGMFGDIIEKPYERYLTTEYLKLRDDEAIRKKYGGRFKHSIIAQTEYRSVGTSELKQQKAKYTIINKLYDQTEFDKDEYIAGFKFDVGNVQLVTQIEVRDYITDELVPFILALDYLRVSISSGKADFTKLVESNKTYYHEQMFLYDCATQTTNGSQPVNDAIEKGFVPFPILFLMRVSKCLLFIEPIHMNRVKVKISGYPLSVIGCERF
jgi:hypothetical protein